MPINWSKYKSTRLEVIIMASNKKFWESKTFWINVVAILTGIGLTLQDNLATGVPLTGIGIVNIILRSISKQAITWKFE